MPDLQMIDDELVRRGIDPVKLSLALGGNKVPAPSPVMNAGGQPEVAPRPVGQPDASGWRHGVDVAADAAASKPKPNALSFMGPRDVAAPEIGGATSGAGATLSFANRQPMAPATGANPADPSAKGAPRVSFVKRFQEAEAAMPNPADYRLKPGEGPQGWKKVLDIAGQIISPRIEAQIPGSRGNIVREKAQQFADAKAAAEQRQAGVKTEAGLANAESEIQRRDAETAKLNEPKPEKPEDQKVGEYTNAEGHPTFVFRKPTGELYENSLGGTVQKKEPAANETDKEVNDYLAARGLQDTPKNRDAARVAIGQRKKPEVDSSDAGAIADSIIAGNQPPDLKGLYRNNAPVRAALARKGFNLVKAEEDWQATQKYMATLNGSQQTRLRQAVGFTKDSLTQVEDIYNQWLQVGPANGWKTFNKGSLAVAKQLPGAPGELAHRLEARVADLTSELGTVYKGGNSSTDESLRLAAQNLGSDWNEQTFKSAIKDIRESIRIRENSMKNLGPAGVSSGNAYTPPATTQPPRDFGAAPTGRKEGSTGKLSDGTPVIVKGGRIVEKQ